MDRSMNGSARTKFVVWEVVIVVVVVVVAGI